MNTLSTLSSLLMSTALLLAGHGMQLTLLPLRAASLGHSDLQIAVGGSAYFAGFIAGCLLVPRIIARVGHIRSFAVLASAMGCTLLLLGLGNNWLLWAALRALLGIFICGLYTVIESWLNDQASTENRGQILSVYTFLVLIAMAGGQMLVNVAPVAEAAPFMIVCILVSLSIVPVGLTRRLAPAPIEATRSRIFFLFGRAPLAAVGAIASGAVSGSFWSLGAVFARRTFEDLSDATLFMAITILGGALSQYFFGFLSDRAGRNLTLVLLGCGGVLGSLAAVNAGGIALMGAGLLFGAFTLPMYAMALAAAADNSLRHEFVEVGTSILLLNAAGAVFAPMAMGQAMVHYGPAGLFLGCAGTCALATVIFLVLYWRKPRVDDVVPFTASTSAMAPTSFDLDPRAPEEMTNDLSPVAEAPSLADQDDEARTGDPEDRSG